jgi:hypothetical protein
MILNSKILTSNKMKKAQINSQVFIYLLAIIVMGVIALIAFKGIKTILDQKCIIEKEIFKKDFAQSIKYYSTPGDIKRMSLSLPCGSMALCFYDKSGVGGDLSYQKQIIEGLAGENNVFLILESKDIAGTSVEAFSVPKMRLNTMYSCISGTTGLLNYRLEGLGIDGTKVSES